MASEEPFDDDAHAEGNPDSFDALLRSAARTPQVLRAGAGLAGGRFRIVRALGRGGMGVVYEALDATRSGRVALKTLTRCGPQDIYRLKNEFRSLVDVAHPNLVALHEFICDGELWFFTMDLHAGENFLSYVRGHEVEALGCAREQSREQSVEARAPAREHDEVELAETRSAGECLFDEQRLRDALRQLVEGVIALHRAGKLHCDLKPGNVIVSQTGQLTILDFGLVSERVGPSTGHTLGNEWGGTPGYMAPEQMSAAQLSPASDYYAIGVMLYESLTGRLPFRQAPGSFWPAADRELPELPPHVTSGSTADLAALCLELLAFEPSARPNEESLLARACRYDSPARRPSVPSARDSTPFVGREAELERLLALRARLEAQRPEAVLIRGPSGIGKTRLAQEFLRGLRTGGELVLLEGRCYERESLPYNAFDSLIDALSRYLRRLPEVRAAALMPRDARVLAELFPVLRRVPSIDAMPAMFGSRAEPRASTSRSASDPLVLRRRAFDALKELLSRISDLSPLVLCIDDLQWADADSLHLLEALLSEPAPPRMLLLGLCLSEHTATAEAIAGLCERQKVALTDLPLLPLDESARRSLIAEQLALPEAEAERLAQESQGNPFFLGELIAAGGLNGASVDLGAVILERAARLSPGMRGLLDLLCVAGAPLDFGVALQAAELAQQGQGLVTELRNERWLRLDPSGKSQRVEIYHDRIRAVLFGALDDAETRRLRQRLAECLEARPGADGELVASHWLAAGATERAAQGFARAASRADKNLAFVAAGRLYARALEHGNFTHVEQQRLRLAMALAFERGGHALAAAEGYLAAARAASEGGTAEAGSEALTLRRSAAQLLLASGSLDAGIEVLREVLAEVGLAYPTRPDQALAWRDAARAELDARGVGRDPAAFEPLPRVADEELERTRRKADACWAAGPTLGSYDFVRAGYFATQGLVLALDTGDALRIARGLSMYATSLASGGDPCLARALAEHARALGEQAGDAMALANAELVLGQVSLFAGDFAHCLAASDRALAMFRGQNAGESLEVHLCNMFANMALHMSGRIDELVRRSREQLANARDRGHIQAEASLRVLGVALGYLLADEVEAAREQGEISARLWPQERFHAERFKVLRLAVWCDLYEGRGEAAFARFAEARAIALESLLLSSRYWSYWWFELALSSSLAAAAAVPEGPARARYLAEAEQAALKLESMQSSFVAPQLAIYHAARAQLAGDRQGALEGLRALCGVAHPLLSACAQVALGSALGGPEGEAVAQLGLRGLGARVKSPARWTAFMLPGFSALSAAADLPGSPAS